MSDICWRYNNKIRERGTDARRRRIKVVKDSEVSREKRTYD